LKSFEKACERISLSHYIPRVLSENR
jgi:hypothetical protein